MATFMLILDVYTSHVHCTLAGEEGQVGGGLGLGGRGKHPEQDQFEE